MNKKRCGFGVVFSRVVLFVWVLAIENGGGFWVFGGVNRRTRKIKSVFLTWKKHFL